jgi:hypothetical protein
MELDISGRVLGHDSANRRFYGILFQKKEVVLNLPAACLPVGSVTMVGKPAH